MGEKKVSGRVPEAAQRRVLDRATRQRRLNRQLEALENDNFGDDPQAGLPRPGKRLPHFADTAETELERGRGSQLRLGVRRPFPPAPAPFLCRLRFPFGVHLRHLRRPVLLQPLPRHPPGHPVLEVDGVTGTPPLLFGDNKRAEVSTAPVSVLVSPSLPPG
uniref:Uncharacterized protein n=1 Tax=Accipiter nisus TaxID=211598 RepID=A0A8B9RYJ2_9AVES